MRCKRCDYRLWNLPARRCPECGTPFRPGEYEFLPNSVQFCCPHCNQAYYGTGAKGHLVPAAFECVSCRRPVHMDQMVLLPAEGLEEDQTRVDRLPWLERDQRGFIRAWLSTIGRAMVAPTALMRVTPVRSSLSQAFWFATFSNLAYALTGLVPFLLFQLIVMIIAASSGGLPAMGFGLGFGLLFAAGVVIQVVLIGIWGLLTHGLLVATGRTRAGLGRTYHAICYSSGANAPMAVPCLGIYLVAVGWVWWLVSATLMVIEAQRVRGLRAAAAVLAFPVVGVLLAALSVYWLITGPVTAGINMAAAAAQKARTTETQVVVDALLAYAGRHHGRGPDHAIELVIQDDLGTHDLVTWNSPVSEKNVPVGPTTLARFAFLKTQEKQAATEAAIQALAKNPIVHRLGDFVFTYHGMDLSQADRELWIVILWPQRSTTASAPISEMIRVGLADGTVVQIPASAFRQRLQEQNQLRARYGLGALPKPDKVTHFEPPGVMDVDAKVLER